MNWWRSKRPQQQLPAPLNIRDPDKMPVAREANPILQMQRDVGNRAVQQMLPRAEGEDIPEGDREKLEASFGSDLADIRIHRDEDASILAAATEASAFTTGRDIYFASGAYGPAALAHEVTHVLQQSQSSSLLPGEDVSQEQQATAASASFMSGHVPEIGGPRPAPTFQRKPAPGSQPSALKLLPTDSVTLTDFEIDNFRLSVAQQQKLDEFAKRLKTTLAASPDSLVTIVGFADAPGTEPHNLALGQKRTETVKNYLTAKGLPETLLHAASLGETAPAVQSSGYESKNRRVEIDVIERSFFNPPALSPPVPLPAPPAPAEKPKIDLTFYPKDHEPTPDEDFQERMREMDKAVREAKEEEKANKGTSAADLAGRVLRNAARKLGLPRWVQDKAESLGKDLPSKGADAVLDQIAGDRSLDSNTRNALKALLDALMRTKVK